MVLKNTNSCDRNKPQFSVSTLPSGKALGRSCNADSKAPSSGGAGAAEPGQPGTGTLWQWWDLADPWARTATGPAAPAPLIGN